MRVMVMIMMMLIQPVNAFYKWLQFLISYLPMSLTLMGRRLMTLTCECIDMNGDNMVDALPPVALGQLLHRLLATFGHVLRRFFQYFEFSTFSIFIISPGSLLTCPTRILTFIFFMLCPGTSMTYLMKILEVAFQLIWSSSFKC